MNLEGIVLNEISQTEKLKCYMISLKISNLKNKQTNIMKEIVTDKENKLVVPSGEAGGVT